MRAGIGLGSNLGDRRACLTNALSKILALSGVRRPLLKSSLYQTDPIECESDAAKFLNAVIEIAFHGEPIDLLARLQEIESALGRPATHEANRSRTIDLDLLYHGTRTIDEAPLQLPHPRMRFRGFVLEPLAEIRPNLVLPNETKTVQQLAEEIDSTPSVVRLAQEW